MIIVMIIDVSCFSSILTSSYRIIINEDGWFLLLFRVHVHRIDGDREPNPRYSGTWIAGEYFVYVIAEGQ